MIEAVPEVKALVEQRLEASLQSLQAGGDATSRVRAAIIRKLPAEEPTARSVARELALSQRSLQRRLAEEGTSFRMLVDETRRALTMQLLTDPSLPLEEVAFLAGFSETRAFYRAFRRWTDTTPGQWRASRRSA